MRRYPAYKPSGVDWLGEVPEGWETVSIKRVASIRYGIGEPPAYRDCGIPLIRATNIHAGNILSAGMVYVDPDEIPASRAVWLEEDDILVVRSGAYTGDSAIVRTENCPAIAGFDMVLSPRGVDASYLQYSLLSTEVKGFQLDLMRMRAAQPHLNAEELGSCGVPLPPLPEQQAIAAFLDREVAKIDALVAEQRRLIELLAEKRQAVISHAVTKGLNPTAPLKPSGIDWLGDIPEGWEVVRLKHVTLERCDGPFGSGLKSDHYTDEGTRVIRLQNIKALEFNDEDSAFINAVYASTELIRHEVVSGDLLIAGLGDDRNLVGRACVAPEGIEPAIVKADCFRFRLNTRKTNTRFIAFQLNVSAPVDAGRLANGTTRARIPLSEMGERAIALPPVAEQHAISAHLVEAQCAFDSLTSAASSAITLLQERRAALISAAVTGKIDVRELAMERAA